MALTPTQKTTLYNEITNDPLGLGYANQTNAQRAVIMNTPGTASAPNRVLVVHDQPIKVLGVDLTMLIADLDGAIDPSNLVGAGAKEVIEWMDTSSDPFAVLCRHFCHPATLCDVTHPVARSVFDYMAGVEMPQPSNRMLISEVAMTALLELGMVLMSRARELMGRSVTEADITEALAP